MLVNILGFIGFLMVTGADSSSDRPGTASTTESPQIAPINGAKSMGAKLGRAKSTAPVVQSAAETSFNMAAASRRMQPWLGSLSDLVDWSGFKAQEPSAHQLAAHLINGLGAIVLSQSRQPGPSLMLSNQPSNSLKNDFEISSFAGQPVVSSQSEVGLRPLETLALWPQPKDLGLIDDQRYARQCIGLPPPEWAAVTVDNGPENKPENEPGQAYEIWVRSLPIGVLPNLDMATQMTAKLKASLKDDRLEPDQIQPAIVNGLPAVRWAEETLFVASSAGAGQLIDGTWLAIAWANGLRQALGTTPLDAGQLQMTLHGFEATGDRISGTASWYGPYFHGRKTANGEIFDQNALTAAHPSLPLGTYLKVTNQLNQRTVVVRVNDRGPYIGDRSLDLSRAAAQCLGSEQIGVIPYEADILTVGPEAVQLSAFQPSS
ncbi:MAG: septal ring lytic transglycosylase RlpA family protein [Cyanobacteria bacterium P01_D01_bin.128]